jgi:hypothetical protein
MPTPSERHRIAELAVLLAGRLAREDWLDRDDPEPGYFHDAACGRIKRACRELWSLGAAVAARGDGPHGLTVARYRALEGGRVPSAHCFRVAPIAEIRGIVAAAEPEYWPEADELMANYLEFACEFGEVPHGRAPFAPPPGFADEARVLVALGYLIHDGERVAWTGRAATAMCRAHLWTDDGLTTEENEERRVTAYLNALDGDVRYRLIEVAAQSQLHFMAFVRDHHRDIGWAALEEAHGPPCLGLSLRVWEKLRPR